MRDTYFVEERSGAIGIGPLTRSPEQYYRRPKTNWGSITSWLHLIICLLAIPLIIWNLFLLMGTIMNYTQTSPTTTADGLQYTDAHWFATMVVLCAILMNLLGGVFALVTEAACFSDKIAKLLYATAYVSIAISIFSLVFSNSRVSILALIIILIAMVLYGWGFWRFTIISSIYLNEEGPVWFKPLLYFCLAAIPLLTTSSQCRETKPNVHVYGCLPNDLFGGRVMYNDYYSFTIMIIIAVISAIPYLLGFSHNLEP